MQRCLGKDRQPIRRDTALAQPPGDPAGPVTNPLIVGSPGGPGVLGKSLEGGVVLRGKEISIFIIEPSTLGMLANISFIAAGNSLS